MITLVQGTQLRLGITFSQVYLVLGPIYRNHRIRRHVPFGDVRTARKQAKIRQVSVNRVPSM